MQVQAKAKYMRISPSKVRKVAHVVKGRPVEAGMNMLRFMPQKAAEMVYKVVQSALANVEAQTSMNVDSLVIQNILVDQGPTLKRFRPRAQGRVGRILKRTSHITVVLDEASGK
ncbi:MAG: 50S ribosomal protein L22 [Proteobacteria bacterium]|nr:50S ribosomal protein L22 [Pseudomonadota bacterium]